MNDLSPPLSRICYLAVMYLMICVIFAIYVFDELLPPFSY